MPQKTAKEQYHEERVAAREADDNGEAAPDEKTTAKPAAKPAPAKAKKAAK